MPARGFRDWGRDLPLAALLAVVLGLAWTVRDWPLLAALRLPDTDDVVRLQQIRDWLDGQRFSDVSQHRIGAPPGLVMHWSRLPDLVPAALIRMVSPLAGRQHAEVAAVILWPLLLFALALALTGRVARALAPEQRLAPTAMIVAALAYPAASLFMPGRIDHHGLQLVLLLLLVDAVVRPATVARGAVAAIATAASLAIGLETAPLLAVAGAALVCDWVLRRRGAADRALLGYGAGLVLALSAGAMLLRTNGWRYPACDSFDMTLWKAAMAAAIGAGALGIAGQWVGSVRDRAIAAGGVAIGVAATVLATAPECLHPYGRVDPLLARVWLAQVAEAQPLFAAPPAQAIGYAGLMVAGIAATLPLALRTRGWAILLALQLAALAITLTQLRGAYAGALLAAPGLAALIGSARARGVLALAAAWIVSAGITYPLLGAALARPQAGAPAHPSCTDTGHLQRLAALPPGRLLASIDLGAYALAATPHRLVAAPYHRNGAGNRTLFDFLRGDAAGAQAIARIWRVDYVALCGADLDGPDGSFAVQLQRGDAPAWLAPLPGSDTGVRLWRVVQR